MKMELAPEVTFRALPFGGAVLVNGVTLGLAECAESDAEAVRTLLSRGTATERLARMANAMVQDGWLVPAGEEG